VSPTPDLEGAVFAQLASLRAFQEQHRSAPAVKPTESPAAASASLRRAVDSAPAGYRDYLEEALACYEGGQYRAAVLMVWAATVQHLYRLVDERPGGVAAFEKANVARFGQGKRYRQIKKTDDFMYLGEADFLQLAEDAGMINRNAREMLGERLKTRNRCGHPTGYRLGREEAVVFIESLLLNVIEGAQVNW
jgi:hypothetical protein